METDKNQKLDDLFQQARTESPKVPFDEMEQSFTQEVAGLGSSVSSAGTSHVFTLKTWTIMLSTLITLAISAYFISGNVENKNTELSHQEQEKIELQAQETNLLLPEVEMNEGSPELINQPYSPAVSLEQRIEETVQPKMVEVEALDPDLTAFADTTKKEDAYRFPIFTEEEKKKNAKLKAKMIKQLIKRDKKKYAYIPSGTFDMNGESISVRPFHMQTTEVTNLEYRIFLFDLLEQGEQSKFLKAKPDQNNWLGENGLNAPMAEFYFSHPAYDNYPVNNISREGAEMYCEWITTQANLVLAEKNKPTINDVRLPSNAEWIFAAKGGMKASPYPWGGPYARNSQGCYLANFSPEGEDSFEDGMDITAPVTSYASNDYGLYCMSGNIAEMVYYKNDKSQPGTCGGSWTSSVQEIQIEGEDKFKGITSPNVNIGFRVVISYGVNYGNKIGFFDAEGVFHYPELTVTEKELYDIQKKKMINKAGDYKNDKYVLFETDTLLFNKDSLYVRDVLIQSSEVTNLEYRTFLIDIIEQGKTEIYKDAFPVQGDETLDSNSVFLSSSTYDNYPVVGVSKKGIESYCQWYTEEGLNHFYAQSTEFYYVNMRLPSSKEWKDVTSANRSFQADSVTGFRPVIVFEYHGAF